MVRVMRPRSRPRLLSLLSLLVLSLLAGCGGTGDPGGTGGGGGLDPSVGTIIIGLTSDLRVGVDIDRLIDSVWLLEKIIGRPTHGMVAKAGPRPATPGAFYDPNMPGLESLEAARHFRHGPQAWAGEGYTPWKNPITEPWFQRPSQDAK